MKWKLAVVCFKLKIGQFISENIALCYFFFLSFMHFNVLNHRCVDSECKSSPGLLRKKYRLVHQKYGNLNACSCQHFFKFMTCGMYVHFKSKILICFYLIREGLLILLVKIINFSLHFTEVWFSSNFYLTSLLYNNIFWYSQT